MLFLLPLLSDYLLPLLSDYKLWLKVVTKWLAQTQNDLEAANAIQSDKVIFCLHVFCLFGFCFVKFPN